MNDKLNETYTALKGREQALQIELAEIRIRLRTLEEVGATPIKGEVTQNGAGYASGATNSLKTQGNGGSRAPAGELERAIIAVLSKGDKLTNGEIRASLEKQGYGYSLTPLHVSKTLTKLLKEEKRIKAEGHKWDRRYFKP